MVKPSRADAALKLLALSPAGIREYLSDMGGCRDDALQAIEYLRRREWVQAITTMAKGYVVYRVTPQGRRRLGRMGYAP